MSKISVNPQTRRLHARLVWGSLATGTRLTAFATSETRDGFSLIILFCLFYCDWTKQYIAVFFCYISIPSWILGAVLWSRRLSYAVWACRFWRPPQEVIKLQYNTKYCVAGRFAFIALWRLKQRYVSETFQSYLGVTLFCVVTTLRKGRYTFQNLP